LSGVPTGGTAGQILAKVDGANYNDQWVDPPAASTGDVEGPASSVDNAVVLMDGTDGKVIQQASQITVDPATGIMTIDFGGTNGKISFSVFGGPFVNIYKDSADTQPSLALNETGMNLGVGGTTVVDVGFNRPSANIIAMNSGDKLQQNAAATVGDDLVNKTHLDALVGAVSAAGRALIDDADAAAQRATLGAVGSDGSVLMTVKITRAAYDALSPPVATTHYIIEG
jgi:hypothetical protein